MSYRPAPIANPRWYKRSYKPPVATVTLTRTEPKAPTYKQVYSRPRYQYTATVSGAGYTFTTILSSDADLTPEDVATMPGVKLMVYKLTHEQKHIASIEMKAA